MSQLQLRTTLAVKNHATTVITETLMIRNMSKNKKLARHIVNCGWGQFGAVLGYKLAENGKNLIRISTFMPSSKECRLCHQKHRALKLKDRIFVCPSCGHAEERDIHASKNILRFGLE